MRCSGIARRPRLPTVAVLLCGAALALPLAACGGTSTVASTVSYDNTPGHILVQLFPTPGFIFPAVNAVPAWTLYGDGTVVYTPQEGPPGAPGQLLTAHLAPDAVEHILDVVVKQYAFFSSARTLYGRLAPDAGRTLLTVDAAGQHKQVSLGSGPGPSPDQQANNIFAIQQFLSSYQPASPASYNAPGVALLVYSKHAPLASDQSVAPWPYPDISLEQAYTLSCAYLHAQNPCPTPPSGQPEARAVYGAHAPAILSLIGERGRAVSQAGEVYQVLAFPLLPDALHPAAGTTAGVLVNGGDRLPLSPPPASA
jgi:hypothetical protein